MPASPAPRAIGPYTLEAELGRGGVGVVYAARGPAGAAVALKLLLPGACGPEGVARFTREVRVLATLRHPNLVACLGAGDYVGSPYLAMERVDGGTLRELLAARGRLPPAEAVALALQIARGLAALHESGLVHRDVKPENVLVTAEGVPKLSDLGLVTGLDFSRLTATRELLGTPSYMAPEQACGEPTSPATDVYALGAVVFELLTGVPPFRGPTALAVLQAQVDEPAPDASELCPEAPQDLIRLVAECLAKDPAARPRDGAALASRLAGLDRGGRAPGPGHRSAAWAVGLALGGLAALGAAWSWTHGPRGADPPPAPAAESAPAGDEAWSLTLQASFARAEARARERVAAEPDDPDALLVLARVLGLRLKDREALEVAVHGLSVASDRGPLLGLLHVIHTRAGQREEAQRIRARLVAEAPDGPDAWLAQMTRTDVTLEERWEQLKGWVAERPDELRVHLSTVSQEAVTGAGDAYFRAALERFPEAQGLLRYFRLQGLSCSDPASALAALARWFPAREQDLDLLCLEAELLLALDQRAAAQARAELACRLDPSSLRAWTWVLTSVKRLGDPALLRTAAERALNAVALEDRWTFEHELGYLALHERRNEDALGHARAMGSGGRVLGARAALEATALRCLGRGEEALEVVSAWTRAEPRDPRAWTERAKHLSAAGRHAEVEPCAETAVDLDPSQGVAWELLAGARFGLGARGERLERPLHEALRLGVDTPGLRLMLATVAFEAGRFAEARAHVDAGRAARTPEPVLADLELLDRRLQARGL